MASTEAGHYEKRVYLGQDGTLVVPSSARVQLEPGAILSEYGNTINAAAGSVTTNLNGVLPNRGISIIKTTAATVIGIRAITKQTVGCRKLVIFDTSAIIALRASTGIASYAVRFGSSICKISQSSDLGKLGHKTVKTGNHLELVATSTDRWYVINFGSTSGSVNWIKSSST